MNLWSRFKFIHSLFATLIVSLFWPVAATAAPYGSGNYSCGLYGVGCGPGASFMDKYGWLIFFALLLVIAWLLFLLLLCRRRKRQDEDKNRRLPPSTTITPNS
ncbi:MAG TPA: hypothetical protein VIK37_00015 [Candidatus Saccharimonadales bacterium]